MSSRRSELSDTGAATPDWLLQLLGVDPPSEGERFELDGAAYVMKDGMIRALSVASDSQDQTAEAFGFKWGRRETFESEKSLSRMRTWLLERYGDVASASWWAQYDDRPLVLDAGCGAGMSALCLLEPVLGRVRYLGADISDAVDVAAARFAELGASGAFIQADVTRLPLADASVDVIFSEGVLHHTDSTEDALKSLATLLRPGGRFLFYVYRRKGPIREFTDDYIRARLAEMSPDEAWAALEPLTELGRALGEMEVTVEVPEDVELLGIPSGRIELQRLFYWHVFKAYWDRELTLEEMNHINYDWYAPRNAHRQSPQDVRRWCEEAGLEMEHENIQEAGTTVIARRRR